MDLSKTVKHHFPALNSRIYANTPASGLLSYDLVQWRRFYDENYSKNGSVLNGGQLISDTRSTIGEFFNCNPENVALVPSFSQGLNLLLSGLSLNEEILLLTEDYPSLRWPFEEQDLVCHHISIIENIEEKIYDTIKSKRITVFACSAVQWQSGIKMDFSFIKQLKKDFPEVMILVDGTQYCGSELFDFKRSGIDIIGTSGYKWLLAGYGNGFFLINPDIMHRFDLKTAGYGSGRNSKQLSHERTFCKHLEPGHLDYLSFGSLNFSLKFMRDIGLEQITAHNRELSKHAKQLFSEEKLLTNLVVNRKFHSTIFNIKGDDALFATLKKKNVSCAQRGDGIRLGFHFYNSKEEITQIVKIIFD